MKLGEYLEPEYVLADVQATTKQDVLREMLKPLQGVSGVDVEKALDILLEREKLGTTGIGDGIAIPHGKLESLDRILLTVGRSAKGVDFAALDQKPCRIFFMVLAPEQAAGMHLRILAHISRLLKNEGFRERMLEADGDKLYKLIAATQFLAQSVSPCDTGRQGRNAAANGAGNMKAHLLPVQVRQAM